MSKTSEFYTTGEVSEILGIAKRTVKNYCNAGKLACKQTPLTNYRRIPKVSLVHFMKENALPLDLLGKKTVNKILVIDDDEVFREFMCQLLSDNFPEATIESAIDGFEACIKAGQLIPDILILDLIIPKDDGARVIRRIKENDTTKHAEIIVVTGCLDDQKNAELSKLNIRHIFQKPLDKKAFLQVIHSVVNRKNH